jgi:bifunctional aspartokinase / homoserine dehydrogenase 1
MIFMNTVVLKIGGGILRDKSSFDRVVNIVASKKIKGEKQIIVISALYGVTDFLINSLDKCVNQPEQVESIIASLKKMHTDYLDCILDSKIKENAYFVLIDKISILEKFFYGISYLKEISPRSKDLVQSFGERLSPIVLEAFLLDAKINAKFIDAEEAGIRCKGNFENAYVEIENTSKNILSKVNPLLEKNVVLLPGFYGIDDTGDVKTFGRGGTDYSAGFICNIFDAKLEIWKDVSGFMSADPKMVPNAKQIESLSYDEAEELGYLGAKIIHPKTIDPLRKKNLCAEVKNVFAPDVKGTIICGERKQGESVVKSVTAIKDVAIVFVESSSMVNVPGFASLIFSKLAEKNISIGMIVTSEASIAFSVDSKNLDKAVECAKSVSDLYPCEVRSQNEVSMLAIVGEGMKTTSGISGKLFSALGNAGINVEMVSQGASQVNVTIVVGKNEIEKAIKTTHDAFVY